VTVTLIVTLIVTVTLTVTLIVTLTVTLTVTRTWPTTFQYLQVATRVSIPGSPKRKNLGNPRHFSDLEMRVYHGLKPGFGVWKIEQGVCLKCVNCAWFCMFNAICSALCSWRSHFTMELGRCPTSLDHWEWKRGIWVAFRPQLQNRGHCISPLLKSPPTKSPLQFHRIAVHRLLNSPPLHYTADKLHRLVNLRHDEFSAS